MGRYWCKPCVAKAELDAAQQNAANPDETRAGADIPASGGGMAGPRSTPNIFDGGDEGLDLATAAKYEAIAAPAELPRETSCPSCKQYMAQEARICIHCGYDRQRKMRLKTTVEKAVDLDGSGKRKRSGGDIPGGEALRWGFAATGLLSAAGGIALWMVEAGTPLAWACFAVMVVVNFTAYIVATVLQFRDGETWWGVVSIVGFFFTFGAIANTLWGLFFSGRPWMSLLMAGSLIGSVAGVGAVYFGPAAEMLGR
jgi:ribosomal protein L37E